MNQPLQKLSAARVAREMWIEDGRPDGYQLGEANRRTYMREADAVFRMIRRLGFKVVKRERRSVAAR